MLRNWIQNGFAAVRNTFINHAGAMDRLTRTKTDNASIIGVRNDRNYYTNMSKLHVKLAIEKSRKMIMKGSKMESKGSQMATKIEPKGCQMAAGMAHKPIQNDPGPQIGHPLQNYNFGIVFGCI